MGKKLHESLNKTLSEIEFNKTSYDNVMERIDNKPQEKIIKKRLKPVIPYGVALIAFGLALFLFWDNFTNLNLTTVEQQQKEVESLEKNTISDKQEETKAQSADSKVTEKPIIEKPSQEEIDQLDIPTHYNNGDKELPETQFLKTRDSETLNIRAYIPIRDNVEVLVSETTYFNGINIPEFTEEVKSWFPSGSIEVIKIRGHVAVLHHLVPNICELQIITEEKLFTVAGADKETLMNIAEQIDF